MKVNVRNMLRQAADTIEHRKPDRGAYAFMLEQFADHLDDLCNGKHTWEEFADFYCLNSAQVPA